MPIEGGGILPLMVAIVGMATLGQPSNDNPQPKPHQREWYRVASTQEHISDEVVSNAFKELMEQLIVRRMLGLNPFEWAIKLKKTADIDQAQVALDGSCPDALIAKGIQKVTMVRTANDQAEGGAMKYHYESAIRRLYLGLRDLYDSTINETHDWQNYMRNTIKTVGYPDFQGVRPLDVSIKSKMSTVPPPEGPARSVWIADLDKLVSDLASDSNHCLESCLPAGAQVSACGNDLVVMLNHYIAQLGDDREEVPASMVSLAMPVYVKDYVLGHNHRMAGITMVHTDLKTAATAVLLDYVEDMESEYGSLDPYDRIKFAKAAFDSVMLRELNASNREFMGRFGEAADKIRRRAELMDEPDADIVDISYDIYVSTV